MILRAVAVFSVLAKSVQVVTPFTARPPARCRETQRFQSTSGKGFGKHSADSGSFVSFDRFRAECPADLNSIQQFDSSLVIGDESGECWVAVFRTANNLPSVFVKDAFLDAMKAATTTVQGGDSETLVSTSTSEEDNSVMVSNRSDAKPVAVARLAKDQDSNTYILDNMRCILKKENTNDDCDGGSEHAEAIGICIDELVVNYLKRCDNQGDEVEEAGRLQFDGGIHFRGTLVSGKLLEARGFREVTELHKDLHSHESDYEGALGRYAARSTSKEIAKNVGARDRALKIVSYLSRIDRDEEKEQVNSSDEDDAEVEYDPWASVKRFI